MKSWIPSYLFDFIQNKFQYAILVKIYLNGKTNVAVPYYRTLQPVCKHLHSYFLGKSGWEITAWQIATTFDTWKLRFPNSFSQLLQGSAPCPRCYSWSAASPEAIGEHLATSKSSLTSTASTLCLSTGCTTGQFISPGIGDSVWKCIQRLPIPCWSKGKF